MQQTSLFVEDEEVATVPGLHYKPSFITAEEEHNLLAKIDAAMWLTSLKRRVQHYGYQYNYKSRTLDHGLYLGPLPAWLQPLAKRLIENNIMDAVDQIIVNEYAPGQGISPHIDCIPCFGPVICSLSLGSACLIDLTNQCKTSILLEPRSLLVLTGDARYLWNHGIAARKNDTYHGNKIVRQRRASLTFSSILYRLKQSL